jgi:arylsulfatase
MIARWPGQVPAGQVQDEAAVMTDWLPTFARLAGATLPNDLEIDGKDIMPVLAGEEPRDSDQGYRYLQYRADGDNIVGAYREGDWKLKTAVDAFEVPYAPYMHDDLLFNLADDIGEENDLAEAMPQKLDEMMDNMMEASAGIGGGTGARDRYDLRYQSTRGDR